MVVSVMRQMLLISLIVTTCLDVIGAMTTTSPSNEQRLNEELIVVLMMPETGELGFERNAAASSLAIHQAHTDGLLTGINVRYARRPLYIAALLSWNSTAPTRRPTDTDTDTDILADFHARIVPMMSACPATSLFSCTGITGSQLR